MADSIVTDQELAAIERAVIDAPFDCYVLRQLAVTYLQLGRPVDAIPFFLRAIMEEADPSDHVNLIYARSQAALQILNRKAQAAS
jgi:hypothetical protein